MATGAGRTRTWARGALGFFVLGGIAASCGGQSSERNSRHESAGEPGDGATSGIGGTRSGTGGTNGGRGGTAGTTSGRGPGMGGEAGSSDGATAGRPEGGESGTGTGAGGEGGDCASGLTKCGGDCVDLESSVLHCGLCNRVCPSNGAVPACIDGGCSGDLCPPGMADCLSDVEGCETSLSTFDNCTACGRSCAAQHATGTCGAQGCERTCDPGWDDCDTQNPDCETRLDTAEHCGACDNACEADQMCEAGHCTPP